ncbi:MAG: ribonuclease E activity regulator RraA [Proteobacteria bacterium]|jgi:regulator of ribonuclease activity A|nr:ribonuclease E activity regulator RraA [Pseudomonadota bacterium]MDA1302159.1 ribonuclease E activity regulator RraA [Pseudomonadota bacterium]
MAYVLPDLCDDHPDLVTVAEPVFTSFGARDSFGGRIATIKCHEDNSLVAERVTEPGQGRVLIVDGGGSLRCGLLGDNLAKQAAENGWEGIVIYGCIRDVEIINVLPLAVKALAIHPMKSVKRGVGLIDEDVHFAGVTFRTGEYAYGDSNGLLVSPRAL